MSNTARRYEHSGNAVATALTGSVTATSTSFSIAATTGWPTGATGNKFWVTIDRGTPSEEHIPMTSRVGNVLTCLLADRGADGGTAFTHEAGATVEHTTSATEADDANALAAEVTTLGGTVVTTTAPQALTNKTFSGAGNVFGPAQTIPPGVILEYAGAAAPTGWLLCDGAAVSRATYAALFAIIGTTHGTGDGSTTFNLPDRRDRVAVGASGTKARGSTGGSADAITVSHSHSHSHGASSGTESADHSHSGQTGGRSADHVHALGISDAGGLGGGGSLVRKGGVPGENSGGATADHSHAFSTGGRSAAHTHGITVNTDATAAGSSGTGANLQPYVAENFIIKT